jgi:hypothetical protein
MKILTLLLAAFLVSAIAVWLYWVVFFPLVQTMLRFRFQNNLDAMRLAALRGEAGTGTRFHIQIEGLLVKALQAARSETAPDTIRFAKTENVSHQKMELQKLIDEANHSGAPDLSHRFDHIMKNIMTLYLLQRPVLAMTAFSMIVGSYFLERCRNRLKEKEFEAAAEILCSA